MEPQEIQRAIQYVTGRTSYDREVVGIILETGFQELTHLSTSTQEVFPQQVLLEYMSQWTIAQTGQPETMVREVFECARQWLDNICQELSPAKPGGRNAGIN
ncbi:MAG: hypothetical protein O7F12_10620 [Nitrospirae bacterium]|nr:hypothetical protein [Nitrospirota bacterium]